MLRLKVNVGIKRVLLEGQVSQLFVVHLWLPLLRRPEENPCLVETRRKLRTDLPTSQSQVITVVNDY